MDSYLSGRRKRIALVIFLGLVAIGILAVGIFMPESAYEPNFLLKNSPPSVEHIFGTDFMGRDMFARTLKGLSISLVIGMLSACISAIIAVILGTAAALSRKADRIVTWLIDLFLAVPHIILLIMISIALGKGATGVIVGVAVTHWPSLTRVIRAEVLSIRNAPFIQNASKLGMSKWRIAKVHMLPYLIPQFAVGLMLIFPHAILHEASITFLGFGLSPEQPAIGIILSESLKYITSGDWWLAVFPGLLLIIVILLFDATGEKLSERFSPYRSKD